MSLAFVALAVTLYAQNEQVIVGRIIKQLNLNRQEKTYTHTDASDYAAGDRIWLKVYVVNSLSHEPVSESLYAYVELVAPDESVVTSAKILCRDGVYAGYLDIPKETRNGRYMLRSYTELSRNAPNYESYHPVYVGGIGDSKKRKGNYKDANAPDTNALLEYMRKGDKITVTTRQDEDSLMLLAHCRAYPFVIAPISRQHPVVLQQDSIPQGIVSLLLISKDLKVLDERLLLSNNGREECRLDITTDKAQYAPNDSVELAFVVPDIHEGEMADISVSVTGSTIANRHSPSSIIAHLMLATDVRGGMDAPEQYYDDTRRADSLLANRKWGRYDFDGMLKGNYSMPEYKSEETQIISGTVKTLLRQRPVENATVSIISVNMGMCNVAITDEKGRFSFNGIDYPKEAKFVLRAITEKGKENVQLLLDERQRPEFLHNEYSVEYGTKPKEVVAISADTIIFDKDAIVLDEVEVVKNRRKTSGPSSPYSIVADKSFDAKSIEGLGYQKLTDLLMTVAGAHFEKDQCYFRTRSSIFGNLPAALAIDDVIMEGEGIDWDMIKLQDVARIDVFKTVGSSVIWGVRGGGGVVNITMKDGSQRVGPPDPLNLKRVNNTGYQRSASFFEQSGKRKTIYWNPHVTSDTIKLGVPNRAGTCHIVVEGVTTEGRLIHQEHDIIVAP